MNRKIWSMVSGLLIFSLSCGLLTNLRSPQIQETPTSQPSFTPSPLPTPTTEQYITSTPPLPPSSPFAELTPVASGEIDAPIDSLIDSKITDNDGRTMIEDANAGVRIQIKVQDAGNERALPKIQVYWSSYNGKFVVVAVDPEGNYLPIAQRGSYAEMSKTLNFDQLISHNQAPAIQSWEDLEIVLKLLEGLDDIKDFGGLIAYLAEWPDILEHAEFEGLYAEYCLTGEQMANLFSGASLMIPGATSLAGSDVILAAMLAIQKHLFEEEAEARLKALEGRHRLRFYITPLPWMTLAAYQGRCDEDEYKTAQIGYFNSIYLRYDPAEWESFKEYPEEQLFNDSGELIESLRHRDIPGCIIHDNLGFGSPKSWKREDSNRTIGILEYRVETWTDTSTRKPVLTVYQYPTGPSGYGARIELRIDQKPKLCIEDADEVLALSEDLIADLDYPIRAEIGPEAVWRPPPKAYPELQNCYASPDSRVNCVTSLMAKYGASEQAIAFTQQYEGQFFLDSFIDKGRVDVGAVLYPNRANDNIQGVLLNGTPEMILVEEAWDIDITKDPHYASLAGKQSNLILWTSDNSLEAAQSLSGGGQRFVISYPLYKGCHACGIGGYGLVAFDFDAQGQFLGKTLLALGASKPVIPNP
jgi:hypothetical protein